MRPRSLIFAAMMLASMVAPSAQQSHAPGSKGGPTPVKYQLALVPNVEAGTFTGDVTMTTNADGRACGGHEAARPHRDAGDDRQCAGDRRD